MGLRGKGARVPTHTSPLLKAPGRGKAPAWKKPGLTRAQRVIAFVESLTITSGIHAGQPFVLRPWQKRIVQAWYADDAQGHRLVRTGLLTLARKNGKGLSLDTPLPTPSGWTTIGDVTVGDELFDETGQPCRVTATSDIRRLDCYAIRFSNGERIIADGEHRWLTTARVHQVGWRSRRGVRPGICHDTQVRTTRELHASARYGRRGDRNHSLAMPAALELAERSLPIDPYVLGCWLGDGTSTAAVLTCGEPDAEHFIAQLEAAGYVTGRTWNARGATWTVRFHTAAKTLVGARIHRHHPENVQKQLRRVGVLGAKHIPAMYLRASMKQRLALLQGLMDTDGWCARRGGACEYSTTSARLADDVGELLASLGVKYSSRARAMRCNRRAVSGTSYRLQFVVALAQFPVFRLLRKLERQKATAARSRTVQIVSVDRVPTVPTRCLAVDSVSELFRVGRSMLPTHNTSLCAALALAHLVGPEVERRGQVIAAATDRDQAALIYDELAAFILDNPDFTGRTNIQRFAKTIEDLPSGTKFRALSSEAAKAHGLNPSVLILDELAQWGHTEPGKRLYDALTTATGARRDPLTLVISTQTPDATSLMTQLVDYGREVREQRVVDPTFSAHIFETPLDGDPWDEARWVLANPALGDFRSLEEMRTFAERAKKMPAMGAAFRAYYLNQPVQAADKWLDVAQWDACAPLREGPAQRPVYLGLDLASRRDLACLAQWFPADDGTWDLRIESWCPQGAITEHTRTDRVPYQQWVDEGWLRATPGESTDYAFIEQRIYELAAQYDVQELAADPWNARDLLTRLGQNGVRVVEIPQTIAQLTAPSKEFERLILERKVRHEHSPLVRWAVGNVIALVDANENIRPDKRRLAPGRKIDPVTAAVTGMARALVHQGPSVYETRGALVL